VLERLHIMFPDKQSSKDMLVYSMELLNINHPSIPPTIEQEYIYVDEKKFKAREKIQRDLILEALKKTKGNVTAAAKLLDIPRSTFYKRLKKFGM
jgi:transcriptional regulator of acetoin/glycerol metabolism